MIKGLLIFCASVQILLVDITTVTLFAKCDNARLPDNRSLSHFQYHFGNDDEDKSVDSALDSISDFHVNVFNSTNRLEFGSSWFANVPILPIVFATSTSLLDGPCKSDVQRYLRELHGGTLWAVQMFDASSKYPDGIISGHTRHFGNFDQCYHLQANVSNNGEDINLSEINGRYCLVDIEYQRRNISSSVPESYNLVFDPNDSAWEAIREKGDFRRVRRYQIQMALCVPASCSADDVEKALREPLEQIGSAKNIRILTSVKREFCQTLTDAPEFSTAARVYCYIFVALFVLVVVSSWYDGTLDTNEDEEESVARDLLLCFSARRNLKSILETTNNHPGLDCIHLIRFFSMSLVIFGHRMMQYFTNPVINADYLEKTYTIPSSVAIYNGPIIVDGFFGIGGLLVSYTLLQELDKRKHINFIGLILIRFLRLTPLYMIVVFFNALILPHLGSGPYWKAKIELERDNCATNWWTNFLYINNYVNEKNLCIFQSWYLSVDYHLYIMALFVVYAFWRLPRSIGYTFLGFLIFICISVPFIMTYMYNLQPIFKGLPFMHEVRNDLYFSEQYIKTHMRPTPYLVGIVAGAIMYDHKDATWRLSKMWSQTLFILFAVVLSITCQSLAFKYFDPGSKLYPLETALYASLHRGLFAFSVCSIVVLITIGDGLDFHYNFFTPSWVSPLAKLTYGAYLVHNINQSYDIGVTRIARTFTFHNMCWDFIPDMVYTFAVSLLLSILIEGPFRKIEKRFITKRTKIGPSEKASTNVIKKVN